MAECVWLRSGGCGLGRGTCDERVVFGSSDDDDTPVAQTNHRVDIASPDAERIGDAFGDGDLVVLVAAPAKHGPVVHHRHRVIAASTDGFDVDQVGRDLCLREPIATPAHRGPRGFDGE